MSLSIQERLKDLRVERGLTLGSLRSRPGFPSLRWAVTKRKTSRTISHYALIRLAKF